MIKKNKGKILKFHRLHKKNAMEKLFKGFI